MLVIYHDVGGAHSTAVAGNLHINRLPFDKIPSKNELLALPTFDKITKKDLGHLLYIGTDEFGAKVYTLGCKYSKDLIIAGITDIFNLTNNSNEKLYIVDTHPTVNLLMKIGGFSSRVLNFVSFGRPIVVMGSLDAYSDIVKIVKQTKEQIKKDLH